ncbi:MAG TPA: hypothetical protein VFN97_28980 [Actinospica sp.]|nr:hypothetical protein [Actinospica sp.]
MSYQPPGPYPVFPQQGGYGPAPKPPIPRTVQRAFTLMLVATGLAVFNVVLSFWFSSRLDQHIHDALNSGTPQPSTSANVAASATGGIIGVGLWIWMALAIRAGKHWARVTGTVFFGISCLSLLTDIAVVTTLEKWLGGIAYLLAAENLVGWVLGLTVVILIWKQESSAYFKPQQYVQYPIPPYPYPQMPGQPMQPQNGAPQQPADPWATPPGN